MYTSILTQVCVYSIYRCVYIVYTGCVYIVYTGVCTNTACYLVLIYTAALTLMLISTNTACYAVDTAAQLHEGEGGEEAAEGEEEEEEGEDSDACYLVLHAMAI